MQREEPVATRSPYWRTATILILGNGALIPDRPLAGEAPVIEAQALGEFVGAALAGRGAVR
jgi:hypothetical protein